MRELVLYRLGQPGVLATPDGCAVCGWPERGHCQWYVGPHLQPGVPVTYVRPDDATRLSRMKMRRAEREDAAWLARPSTCLACPDGCNSCTRDESDCECYEHQEDHPDVNSSPIRIEAIRRGQVVAGVGPVINDPCVELDGKVRIVTEQETITGKPGEFLQVWMDSGSYPGGVDA